MTAQRCTLPPRGRAAAAASRHRDALPRIETARLVLRAPEMADFPLWERLHAEDGAEFIGGPCAGEPVWDSFCTYVAGWLLHGHGLFAVTRRADGATIGFVLLGLEWGDEEPELGWAMLPEARGQGHATEAAAAVRDWGFDLMASFVSCVAPENARSASVARRLGASLDGAASVRRGAAIWRHGRAA